MPEQPVDTGPSEGRSQFRPEGKPGNGGISEEEILRRRAKAMARPVRETDAATADLRSLFCFRIGTAWFAIEAEEVWSAVKVPQGFTVPGMPKAVPGLLQIRGQLVAAVQLPVLLGVPLGNATVAAVAGVGDNMVAFLADEVGGVRTYAPQQIHATPAPLGTEIARYARAVTNDLVVLLDLGEVFNAVRNLVR